MDIADRVETIRGLEHLDFELDFSESHEGIRATETGPLRGLTPNEIHALRVRLNAAIKPVISSVVADLALRITIDAGQLLVEKRPKETT